MTSVAAPIQASGQDDLSYLRAFREDMRDMPRLHTEQANGNGVTTIFQCQRQPINDDAWLSISVDGVAQTFTYQFSQLGTYPVYVDLDSATVVFATAPDPGTNNVVIQKRWVRWRDSVIIRALYEGLKALFPRLWVVNTDTSIVLATNVYEYQLPPDFRDPRSLVLKVERMDIPSTINPWIEDIAWIDVGLGTIKIPYDNYYTPGTRLRVTWAGPYQSLSDLEPQASELPMLYAKGMLLGDDEALRSRSDSATVSAGAGANPPGTQQNAGQWYLAQFERKLAMLQRPLPVPRPTSTYIR